MWRKTPIPVDPSGRLSPFRVGRFVLANQCRRCVGDLRLWLTHFRRLMMLAPQDRTLLIFAFVLMVLAKTLLALFTFAFVRRVFEMLAGKRRVVSRPALASLCRIDWSLDTAARRLQRFNTCLPCALTAYVLSRRQGLQVRLHIGVGKPTNGTLRAHAWVESSCGFESGFFSRSVPSFQRVPLSVVNTRTHFRCREIYLRLTAS